MKSENESLELIRRYIDGTATEVDRQALQELLRWDPAMRRLYARYANLDATLGSGSLTLGPPASSMKPVQTQWLSWRPLTAAAAGLVVALAPWSWPAWLMLLLPMPAGRSMPCPGALAAVVRLIR